MVNNLVIDNAMLVETIHCLSLIIDDMPDMDNDSERRGIKTFHHKYGDEYTKFFIYYIVNKITLIANRINQSINRYLLYNYEFTDTLVKNLNNLVIGQMQDLQFKYNFVIQNKLNNNVDQSSEMYKTSETIKSSKANRNAQTDLKTKNESIIIDNITNVFIKIYGINSLTAVQKELFIDNIVLNLNKTGSLFQISTLSYISKFYLQNCTKRDKYNIDKLKQIILMKYEDVSKLDYYKQSVIFFVKQKYEDYKNSLTSDSNPMSRTTNDDEIYVKSTVDNKKDLENFNHQYLNSKIVNYIHFSFNIWIGILGIIFQYSDDILDMEKDIGNNPNITNILKKEDVITLIKNVSNWLQSQLIVLDKQTQYIFNEKINKDIFIEIIKKINNRCK